MFNSDLPKPETVFPFTRAEVMEARKRVVFKRALRRLGLLLRDTSTSDLRQLYFLLLKNYAVQPLNDPRAGFKKWGWDIYYPWLSVETLKQAFHRPV